MISIIIITKNRPNDLVRCLKAIIYNNYRLWETIVIDQSDNHKTYTAVNKIKDPRIIFFQVNFQGKSKGLNYAIERARGNILAFTDDDCIVTNDWLRNIHSVFESKRSVSAVFGTAHPYRPAKNNGNICPSCQTYKKPLLFTRLPPHRFFFFGNCMAIRKICFSRIGVFKEWLGVGSISHATEDEEFAFRLLTHKLRIIFEPKIVVFHNRWLTKVEYNQLMRKYKTGLFSAFVYHALKKNPIAINYIVEYIIDSSKWSKEFLKLCISGHLRSSLIYLHKGVNLMKDLPNCVYGTLIGLRYGLKELF